MLLTVIPRGRKKYFLKDKPTAGRNKSSVKSMTLMRRHLVAGILLSLALGASAAAQGGPVWRIGAFDNSHEELGPASAAARVFHVGSSAHADWPGTQQAVVAAKAAEGAAHKIQFDLASAP